MHAFRRPALTVILAALSLAAATTLAAQSATRPAPSAAHKSAPAPHYDATIRWTSYGIPHVTSNDWGGLGYGFAYATMTDAACTLARDIVKVRGDLSRTFGPDSGNRESDLFHRALLPDAALREFTKRQSATSNRFTDGYVAGYNRYLRDHANEIAPSCKGAPWVGPVTVDDITRLGISVGIRYGVGRFMREMAAAAPPSA